MYRYAGVEMFFILCFRTNLVLKLVIISRSTPKEIIKQQNKISIYLYSRIVLIGFNNEYLIISACYKKEIIY